MTIYFLLFINHYIFQLRKYKFPWAFVFDPVFRRNCRSALHSGTGYSFLDGIFGVLSFHLGSFLGDVWPFFGGCVSLCESWCLVSNQFSILNMLLLLEFAVNALAHCERCILDEIRMNEAICGMQCMFKFEWNQISQRLECGMQKERKRESASLKLNNIHLRKMNILLWMKRTTDKQHQEQYNQQKPHRKLFWKENKSESVYFKKDINIIYIHKEEQTSRRLRFSQFSIAFGDFQSEAK